MFETYRNPIALTDMWDGREIGDPFLMRHDGRFYLYCSSHGGGGGIKCWTSEDMIHFDYQGYVCTDPRIFGAYAPEVAYNAGRFWMVTSPRGSGHYLLVADSPLGEFRIVTPNLGIGIDGSLYVDDDGKEYFYRASHQGIRVHDMPAPDTIDVRSRVIEASYLQYWTEGPQVIKRDGRYYLTDTGNHVLSRGYHVDYCVSHEGPDRGYRRLRDGVLLIETRDEFHALGHSSSCVGPDMDTMYIIYHKNILNPWNHPLHRSMNIDRFFFNGDRMYCNATWWRQMSPIQPVCVSRDGEGLVEGRLPVEASSTCTAEINLRMTADAAEALFLGCTLTMHTDRRWTLSGPVEAAGTFPQNTAMDALITLKVSLRKGRLVLCVNNQEFLRMDTALTGGPIGVGKGSAPSFIGLSHVAQGSADTAFPMSVPGAFDAVHCAHPAALTEGETGCQAVVLHAGETLQRALNVWKTGEYYLSLTLRASDADAMITVNGQLLTAKPAGAATGDGMEKRCFGRVRLEAGNLPFELTALTDLTIDRIYLTDAEPFAEAAVIDHGEDVSGGALMVIGHKAANSMHTKFCGYTAAEGLGEGYFGGTWADGEVRAVVNMSPASPEARASIFIRSSRESWHPHQVGAGRNAYCLRITADKITLSRHEYLDTPLAEAPIDVVWGGRMALVFRAQGNTITVCKDGEVLLQCTDPVALPCGRIGIDAVCDGIGFEALSVHPVK